MKLFSGTKIAHQWCIIAFTAEQINWSFAGLKAVPSHLALAGVTPSKLFKVQSAWINQGKWANFPHYEILPFTRSSLQSQKKKRERKKKKNRDKTESWNSATYIGMSSNSLHTLASNIQSEFPRDSQSLKFEAEDRQHAPSTVTQLEVATSSNQQK